MILWLNCTACVPMVANFSKDATAPTEISPYAPSDSQVLVLPMWEDTRMLHFHSSYVMPATAIGTPAAAVPRRTGMYLDSLVCGGPTTFVVGYLVVVDTGTFVWSDDRGLNASIDTHTLKPELKTLITSGNLGPALRELIQYGSVQVAFDLSRDERKIATKFLDRIPDEK